MRPRRIAALTWGLAPLLICTALYYRYALTGIAHLFGGRSAIARVRSAPRVEAFLVHDPWGDLALATQPTTQPTLVDKLSIRSGPLMLDASQAAHIAQIVTDPSIYDFDPNRVSTCMFHADAAIRFTNGSQTVIVASCFTCDQVRVYLNGTATNYQTPCPNGREKLLRVYKQLFPTDQRIQSFPLINPRRSVPAR